MELIKSSEFRISTEWVLPGLPGMIPRTLSIVLDPHSPLPHTHPTWKLEFRDELAQSLATGTHHPRYNLDTRSYRKNPSAMLCLLGWSQQNGLLPGCCLLSKQDGGHRGPHPLLCVCTHSHLDKTHTKVHLHINTAQTGATQYHTHTHW